jgi:lipoyl-dependent peroxiredoxin
MFKRTSSAQWSGDLKGGSGTVKLGGGHWSGPYNFVSRFDQGDQTNPEELIGAAHAGCFSMAFANELSQAGFVPASVETQATVTLEMLPGGPTVTGIHLECSAEVSGINSEQFAGIAEATKSACPISRLLSSVPITLSAKLSGAAPA